MGKLTVTLLTCLLFLSPTVVLSETMEDLVQRDGLYYKKFTDVPFTGKTTGKIQASFKNGKKHGPWISYRENGQLWTKSNYENGKLHGPWVSYHDNGQLKNASFNPKTGFITLQISY